MDAVEGRSEELKKVKKMVELVGESRDGGKDKKLIEIAKSNRNLKLKFENLKSQYEFAKRNQ